MAEYNFYRFKSSGERNVTLFSGPYQNFSVPLIDGKGLLGATVISVEDGLRLKPFSGNEEKLNFVYSEGHFLSIKREDLVEESRAFYYSEINTIPQEGINKIVISELDNLKRITEKSEIEIDVKAIKKIEDDFVILITEEGDLYYTVIKSKLSKDKENRYLCDFTSQGKDFKEFKFEADIMISDYGYESVSQFKSNDIDLSYFFDVKRVEGNFYKFYGFFTDEERKENISIYTFIEDDKLLDLLGILVYERVFYLDEIVEEYEIPRETVIEATKHLVSGMKIFPENIREESKRNKE